MRLIQFYIPDRGRRVGIVDGDTVSDMTSVRPDWRRVIHIAECALQSGTSLATIIERTLAENEPQQIPYETLLRSSEGRAPIGPPISASDQRRILISGTGLTHMGGMKSRDQMHSGQSEDDAVATDSSRMFQMGIDGGKPPAGQRGTAPEWFYKGSGFNLRGRGQALEIPRFAKDGGEEPEVAAVYIIDESGTPRRLGFCLGNEWSDHPFEKTNYLYLAPSKIRTCSIGPELVTDLDFSNVELRCTVQRDDTMIYDSGPLLSGEDHMCHSLANCEDHHFKFPQHRRPGDIHVHFFGTSRLSFGERDWVYEEGDVITIRSPQFGAPLVNTVVRKLPDSRPVAVRPL